MHTKLTPVLPGRCGQRWAKSSCPSDCSPFTWRGLRDQHTGNELGRVDDCLHLYLYVPLPIYSDMNILYFVYSEKYHSFCWQIKHRQLVQITVYLKQSQHVTHEETVLSSHQLHSNRWYEGRAVSVRCHASWPVWTEVSKVIVSEWLLPIHLTRFARPAHRPFPP